MNDIMIGIAGEAGQGIQTFGDTVAKAMFRAGYNVFTDKSYHSRIRGGEYIYSIRIAERRPFSIRDGYDLVLSMSEETTEKLLEGEHDRVYVVADEDHKDLDKATVKRFGFSRIAEEVGEKRAVNTVMLGALMSLMSIEQRFPEKLLEEAFGDKEDVLEANINALRKGYEISLGYNLPDIPRRDDDTFLLMTGTEAAGYGAISAGCRFLSAYPMTPGTGVMNVLAANSEKHSIVVEQAEDEIAAINMAIGAAFAGVRSMVTTSGGGFALMQEGVSLAGMTETPVVAVVAQRPAPATGLPTRTAQEDLFFVMKSGHGEFARYVVAPRNAREAFELTRKAFFIADKYQVPAFILLSQQLVDSSVTIEAPSVNKEHDQRFIERRKINDYKRFSLTESGISPRVVPGAGTIIRADSDEHDEYGFISEDLSLRKNMVEKRMKKLSSIVKESAEPLWRNPDADTIIIGWGDSWGAIDEAVSEHGRNLGYLHFNEVFPLRVDDVSRLSSKKLVTIEGNYSGLFGEYFRSVTGLKTAHVGKYDGRPITPQWILGRLVEEGII